MLHSIGNKENIPDFLRKVKAKECRLMGFGHRVYKNFDPRAKAMKKLCHEVLKDLGTVDPDLEVAMELERLALSDDYFTRRKLYPNVDFYSGIVLRAIGIPTSMFTVMFAMARCVGWFSHWLEMHKEDQLRIGRPRQMYVGSEQREYRKKIGHEPEVVHRKVQQGSFIQTSINQEAQFRTSFQLPVPDDDKRKIGKLDYESLPANPFSW